MSNVKAKDPSAVLTWSFDWSDWLVGSDTIAASTWSVEPTGELTAASGSNTTSTTTIILSAGNLRGVYRVTNHITTAGGLQDDRTITIRIGQR